MKPPKRTRVDHRVRVAEEKRVRMRAHLIDVAMLLLAEDGPGADHRLFAERERSHAMAGFGRGNACALIAAMCPYLRRRPAPCSTVWR